MAEPDPFDVYAQARARIRDAAKWIVTILGSTIVLIIGGGLIANIPALSLGRILGAAGCLVALTALCVFPLVAAIRILVSPFVSFELMATDAAYQAARDKLDAHLKVAQPLGIVSVAALRAERTTRQNTWRSTQGSEKTTAKSALDEVEQQVREAIELASIRNLEGRFDIFLRRMVACGVGVAACLTLFLVVLHKDVAVERMLTRPNLVPLELNDQLESVLRQSDMQEYCYRTMPRPAFVRIAEIPDHGSVVLVVPNAPGGTCDPVRVILTKDNKVDVAD